jgi:hypothetical protein
VRHGENEVRLQALDIMFVNFSFQSLHIPSMLEILPSLEKIDSALWGTVQNDIQIKIS